MTYGAVPPAGVITTDPVEAPKHNTLTWLVSVALNAAAGWVIVALTVVVQPLLSVTVKVYGPAVSPVWAGVMTYGAVPPAGVITTDPVDPPKHNTLTWLVRAAVNAAAGCVIVALTVVVHPLLSVTVKV
jgi:branched-subunit amino acid ABC-type transport system permease component